MKAEDIGTTINKVAEVLNKALGFKKGEKGRYIPMEGHVKRIVRFAHRINPRYPTDSIDLLDLVISGLTHDHLPDPHEIDILEEKIHDADFYRGELRWKYKAGVLTAQFSPKDGGFYEIIFVGDGGATSFPLTVTVHVYSNMDDPESHSEFCPIYNPEHDEDCPVILLATDGRENHSLDEIVAAQQECECGSDDCCCESEVTRTEERTFNEPDEWFADFDKWLLAAHWGGMDKYVSAYATHKLEYVNEDRRVVGANCSCGQWTAQTSKENAKGELRTQWIEHLKNA